MQPTGGMESDFEPILVPRTLAADMNSPLEKPKALDKKPIDYDIMDLLME